VFISQLYELDHFRFPGFGDLSDSQRRQLLSTFPKELTLYRRSRMELKSKLPANDEQVTDNIATLSSKDVFYDGVDPIGRDSPV